MDKLENAIQKINSGEREEGLRLLIEVARADPGNENAWLWLGATLSDPQKRKDCLERVLKINPDNQRAARLLQQMEEKEPSRSSQPRPAQVAVPAQKTEERPAPREDQEPIDELPPIEIDKTERTAAENKIQRALSLHMRGDTQKALKSFAQGLDLNPNLIEETFTRSVAAELTGLSSDQAIRILMDPEDRKALLSPPKEKAMKSDPGKDSEEAPKPDKPDQARKGLVQTWLRFFQMTEDFFRHEIGPANMEDTLVSMLVHTIAMVIIFLISGSIQLQQINRILGSQLGDQMPNLGSFFFILLIGVVIMAPVSLFLGAGLQYLGLRLFGGAADFKSHLYTITLITVPMTVISLGPSLLFLIPIVRIIGVLAGLGLLIFGIIINVRAMKVVHNLPTGRAVAGILLPPLILVFIGGCILIFLGSVLAGVLETLLNQGAYPQ